MTTILVVDDDERIARLIERQLVAEGFDVARANGADEALKWVDSNGAPDLLISDVRMPGMSGPDLYRHLKEHHADLAVLFTSGYTGDLPDRDVSPLLTKPFSRAELVAAVKAAL